MPNDERERRNQFRLQTTKVFLTYPRCGERQSIESFLKEQPNIRCFIVAAEHHSDGEPHIHAYVEYGSKLHTRNERYFDVAGYHPNIQAVRSKNAVLEYVTKDNDFTAQKKLGTEWENWRIQCRRTWTQLIEQSGSADQFMESAKEQFPRDYVLQNDRLQLFADRYYRKKCYTPRHLSFKIPVELNLWRTLELDQKPERPKGT